MLNYTFCAFLIVFVFHYTNFVYSFIPGKVLVPNRNILKPLKVLLEDIPTTLSKNDDFMNNSSSNFINNNNTSTNTNHTSQDLDQRQKEFNQKIKELAEPLLDLQLITKTLEQWSRPLPTNYLVRPLVFVGPSGVGKGRLISALLMDYSKFFKKVVTHTTRNPRPDELYRQSYHFISNHSFHELVQNASFIEWAKVHNNYYGTSLEAFKQVQKEGKISHQVSDIDSMTCSILLRDFILMFHTMIE